jgi:hypothetical protein
MTTLRLALVLLAASVAACAQQPTATIDEQVARDVAERHEVIAAMQRHPAQAGIASATGAPISVPTEVRPRPPGVVPGHHHHGLATPGASAAPSKQAPNQHGDHSG